MQLCSKPRGARGIEPETFRRRVSFYLVLRPLDIGGICIVWHAYGGRKDSITESATTDNHTSGLEQSATAGCDATAAPMSPFKICSNTAQIYRHHGHQSTEPGTELQMRASPQTERRWQFLVNVTCDAMNVRWVV